MRRFIAGMALLAGLATLLVMPLASTGQPPNLAHELKRGVDKTLGGVNDAVARLREEERKRREREAARRAAAGRAATPNPQGQGYTPPLHGTNPHGQGTVGSIDSPPSDARPLPGDTAGGDSEIVVLGRSRGEEIANGTYRGQISLAALFGNDLLPPVTTNPGETETFAPLEPVLTPICNATDICLTVLNATSTTTANGSANRFAVATASAGGPTGINAAAASSSGSIAEDANCQVSRGESNVADASIGTFTADALQSTSVSRECKDGTRTVENTSRVVNLGTVGLQLPPLVPAGCAMGTPNTPALIPGLLPAICNADEINGAQAAASYGVREALTVFVADLGNSALLKATTGASESRAFKRAECSDGVDNDGDGRIDFPNDPDCTGPTDDSEAGDEGGNEPDGGRGDAECEDGRDNDGDGKVDFPNDPGCSSASDDSEADGAGTAGAGGGGGGGAGDAECEDGRDNDGDGKVDFPNDPGCSSASDDSEGGGGNALAFTGTNLVLMFLMGSLVLLAGLRLRALMDRRESRARRAGMA